MKRVFAVLLAAALLVTMAVPTFAAAPEETLGAFLTNLGFAPDPNASALVKQVAGEYTVTPGKTIAVVPGGSGLSHSAGINLELSFSDAFKLSAKKNLDEDKVIKSIKQVHSYELNGARKHAPAFMVELNNDYTDNEAKFTLQITIQTKVELWGNSAAPGAVYSTKAAADLAGAATTFSIPKGTKASVVTKNIYVTNFEGEGDLSLAAGYGAVIKPIENADNEIEWEDGNKTLATLSFSNDNSTAKYFPKLRTSWESEEYAAVFANTDAYVYEFISSPYINTTSRATLEIRNPFVDENGELLYPVGRVMIYIRDVNGKLTEASSVFTAETNDQGESVFVAKVRQLETYVFSADQAAANAAKAASGAAAKGIPTGVYY